MGRRRPRQRHVRPRLADGVRRRRRPRPPRVPLDRRRGHLGTRAGRPDRVHPAQGRARRGGRPALRRDVGHRRPVRRREGRGLAARHRQRGVDRHQPRARRDVGRLLRLLGADDRPTAPGHPDGRRPGLVVAGRDVLPQHRRGRDVVTDLGLGGLPEPHAALHPGHLRRSVAVLRRDARAARGEPQAGLDDRGVRDRPVRLRPRPVRHRRHDLRHRRPHGVGRRRDRRHLRRRAGHRGDRGARPRRAPRARRAASPRWATSGASGTTTSPPSRP